MTAGKRFKRLVRARSSRTGESYSAALRHFRPLIAEDEIMPGFDLRRIEKPHLGFAVHIPEDWREEPPNLSNSPHEVARFYRRGEITRGIIVFRDPRPRNMSPADVRAETRQVLDSAGYRSFVSGDCMVAGRKGARLDFAGPLNMPPWTTREYFVHFESVAFCFALGTTLAEGDAGLFDAIASGLEIFVPQLQESLPSTALAGYYPNPLKAVARARELAASASVSLSTEHIVVALMEIGEGVAFNVLTSLGLTTSGLREAVARLPAAPEPASSPDSVAPAAYRVLAIDARAKASALGHNYIGTEHVLLAIATEPGDEGWRLLAACGVEKQAVRAALADYLEKAIEAVVRGVGG